VPKANDERPPELTEQELDDANGEQLPERHAMTLLRGFEPLPMPIVPEEGVETIELDDPHPS
jgi:hypothetical protein